jgi:hypothetical protein
VRASTVPRRVAIARRKPSYTRGQFNKVLSMLWQQAVGIAHIAKEPCLTRQTVYRIKGNPAGGGAALAGSASTSTIGAARTLVCGRPRARRSRSRWNKNLSDGLKW